MKLKSLLTLTFAYALTFISFAQSSIEKDKQQGEEANEQLKQSMGVYHHPVQGYLDSIGFRLASNLENKMFDYRYGIIDMNEPNALALPGGYVYFSRGILILANSEDELAGVMGHETIHVHQRHSRKAQNKSIFTGIMRIPGAIVGVFSPTAGGLLMAPFSLMDASYSRKHEKQADKYGAELAAKSGYNPKGLVIILNKIEKDTKMETGKEEQKSFFSTHPYTPKRIEELDNTIKKLSIKKTGDIAPTQKAYLDKLEGIVIGNNPEQGVFLDSLFIQPELNFTIIYPKGWKSENSPSMAGIYSPDEKAQLVFTLSDTSKSPDQLATDFAKSYYQYSNQKPSKNSSLKINGFPAHILSYQGQTEEGKVIFNLVWLKRNDHSYKFAGISTEKYGDMVLNLAKSLHTITPSERDMVEETVVHIVQSNNGETLKELSKRTGNVLELDYLALINNLEENAVLKDGQWVKVGIVVKYQ